MKRLRPGDTLGTCEIEAFVAEGGMAAVYRAHQKLMDRTVAVKVLRPALLKNSEALAAFLKEGMAGARLSHPSIAQVYYTAEDSGAYYIVMDFVEGEDLKSVLARKGTFPLRRALEITRQIAEVLAFAHDRGIVHRDIKPANIMLAGSGEIVLTDFGIAALLQDSSKDGQKNIVCGTPSFMSPEQYLGQLADGRSDLYSLGATFFNLVTGSPPFKDTPGSRIERKVLKEPPPSLHRIRSDIPRNVSRCVDRLLAKKPEDRYQSARDVVAVIDVVVQKQLSVTSRLPKLSKSYLWRRSFWWPAALSVVALWIFGHILFFTLAWWFPGDAESTSGPATEKVSGSDGSSGNETGQSDPGSSRVGASLNARIKKFSSYLINDNMIGAQRLVVPEIQNDLQKSTQLLNSLVSIRQDLKKVTTSRSDFTVLQQAKDKAVVALLIGTLDGGSAVQIVLGWERDETGTWFIRPNPETNTIRHIVHSVNDTPR